MKSSEIKHNVQNLIDNFSKDEFVFELLAAYGISKISVTRLKKGDYNLSKIDGEILYKKKIFFKVEAVILPRFQTNNAVLLVNNWV